jgi:hypothetical protein
MYRNLIQVIYHSLLALALVALFTPTLLAEVKGAKVGDKLEVDFNNTWHKCTVLGETGKGRFLRARVDATGQIVNYQSTRFRELTSAKPAPTEGNGGGTSTTAAGGFESWTDATGNFRIEAKFVELANNVVKLQRKDGKFVSVPLNKLSKAAQERVRQLLVADNPFAVVETTTPSPMPSTGERATTPPRATGSATTLTPGGRVPVAIPATVLPTNSKSARAVIPQNPSKSTYQPDPVAARKVAEDPIGLPAKSDFFEKITYLAVNRVSLVAVASRNATFGQKKGLCEVDLIDLGSASLLNTLDFSSHVTALDVIASDNSIRFATRSGGDGTKDAKRLDVWERTATGLTHLAGWEPYEGSKSQITFAGFTDPDTIITINGAGDLASWEVKSGKALYTLKAKLTPAPIFSPGRKYLVVGHELGVAVMDAKSGKFVTVVGDSSPGLNYVCFSPDGSRLATLTIYKQLKLWDLSNGELLDDILLPLGFTTSLCWPDDNHFLISKQYLYDLERRIVLWQYQGISNDWPLTQIQGDQFLYVASANNNRAMFSAQVPEAKAIARGKSLNAEKLLALKPGSKVSIRMQTNYTQDDQRKTYEALATKLQANGIEVVQSSQLVLTATSKKGETRDVEYRSFGSGGRGTTTHQVTKLLYSLVLYEGRENIWSTAGTGGPSMFISSRGNESTADTIRRLNQPSPTFFLNAKIPKLIARPAPGKIAYGATAMVFGGMKTAVPSERK